MKFSASQENIFGTDAGSYSIVTPREHTDSQITLTDYEAELAVGHFGEQNLLKGNVGSDRVLAAKSFRLHPHGNQITLNIVFPKQDKTELRLYLSATAGFKPVGGKVWFMYRKDADLWIGSMAEHQWRAMSSGFKQDDSDDTYQESVNDTDKIRIDRLGERDAYRRDPAIASQRLRLSGYQCEYDPSHGLFISRFSQLPFLEAHHLIPMGMQTAFSQPLDTVENVFCLCPGCHRAVHHADEPVARQILGTLADKRSPADHFSLDVPDLFSLYAIEEID